MHDQSTTAVKLCECGCEQPAPIATYTNQRWGWVKGQPKRFVSGHQSRRGPVDYVERDCGHDTPCWIWARYVNGGGYGRTSMNGRGVPAHVRYWIEANGLVPAGLELDHLCRVKACVNPDHLEAVTHAENIWRGAAKKWTEAEITDMLTMTAREAANRYGVSASYHGKLKNGKAKRRGYGSAL